jgi:hypothetical protein
MTGRRRQTAHHGWQSRFITGLVDAGQAAPDTLTAVKKVPSDGPVKLTRLTFSTHAIQRRTGGLDLQASEDVIVATQPTPAWPPSVYVTHDRFVGFPHVLTDGELCIYLDPSREWNPEQGAPGFLHRLFRWFEDAAANRFDPETALFHPVGGRAHTSIGSPTFVVRDELSFDKPRGFAYLVRKNDLRFDLRARPADMAEQVLLLRADQPLTAGPGGTADVLFQRLNRHPDPKAATWINRLIRQVKVGADYCHLVVGVPRPRGFGHYLLVGRTPVEAIKDNPTNLATQQIEWCTVSDERPSVSRRRDHTRPIAVFRGRRVSVLGCGGLGSWIAELLARADVASLELTDYAAVGAGLLVRQNYTDDDIGHGKAESLARRLRAVAPETTITANHASSPSSQTIELLHSEDGIVIDATVSRAMAQMLDQLASLDARGGTHAEVCTDVTTGSLGLVTVATASSTHRTSHIDAKLGQLVRCDPALEPYLGFWEDRQVDELFPTPGCSYPTFHGSAADLAAVAAEAVNLIAMNVAGGIAGAHLFALPHAGVHPQHHFLASP